MRCGFWSSSGDRERRSRIAKGDRVAQDKIPPKYRISVRFYNTFLSGLFPPVSPAGSVTRGRNRSGFLPYRSAGEFHMDRIEKQGCSSTVKGCLHQGPASHVRLHSHSQIRVALDGFPSRQPPAFYILETNCQRGPVQANDCFEQMTASSCTGNRSADSFCSIAKTPTIFCSPWRTQKNPLSEKAT